MIHWQGGLVSLLRLHRAWILRDARLRWRVAQPGRHCDPQLRGTLLGVAVWKLGCLPHRKNGHLKGPVSICTLWITETFGFLPVDLESSSLIEVVSYTLQVAGGRPRALVGL